MTNYTIKELPKDYRPRERLLNYGSNSLSDFELLGILLRVGSNGETAIKLGERLIKHFGSIKAVSSASANELIKIKGIGEAKAAQVLAAFEIGRRYLRYYSPGRSQISSPPDAIKILEGELKSLDREHFKAILMDTKNHIIGVSNISVGSLNSSIVHPRELFKDAIRNSANSMILAHNHPSGDTNPSNEDINLTRKLVEIGNLLGISIVDHIIIGNNEHFSFKEKNLI